MIVPDRHTEIRYTVLYVAAVMLKAIQANGIIRYEELLDIVCEEVGKPAKPIFPQALCFLFLVGRIEYRPQADTIQLLNP